MFAGAATVVRADPAKLPMSLFHLLQVGKGRWKTPTKIGPGAASEPLPLYAQKQTSILGLTPTQQKCQQETHAVQQAP